MHNIFENIFLSRELYQAILTPICMKYEMTHAELITLLFLACNPELNTATDVVKGRRLTKSAVSMAVRSLQDKGFITGEFTGGNHRSVHLNLCDKAKGVVDEGMSAQNAFYNILTNGFTDDEKDSLKIYFQRVSMNIKEYHNLNRENNGKR